MNPCPPTDVGLAQTTLTVPAERGARVSASRPQRAGVTGAYVASRSFPGAAARGPAIPTRPRANPRALTLGASPLAIQVTGTGGTEQATIIARVFDNNNNPLSGHVVSPARGTGFRSTVRTCCR